MKSIRLFVIAIVLLVTSWSANAQSDSTAKTITDKLNTQLHFSNDQYSQVYTVNQNFVTSLQKIKTDGGSKLTKFKSLKSADENRDAQMKQILSSDQYKLYLDNKEKKRAMMKSLKN